MESLKELYRIGPGPSSSHTLAIKRICECYLSRYPKADLYEVTLYGSLSLTGKGHMTDSVIEKTFYPQKVKIIFSDVWKEQPNTLTITDSLHPLTFYSTGGGAFEIKGEGSTVNGKVYPETSMNEILNLCEEKHWDLVQYVLNYEPDILYYLETILKQMFSAINKGLNTTGILPGKLKIERISGKLYEDAKANNDPNERMILMVTSFAYASSEENASGGTVVTAPTLGSCGVLPAVLYYYEQERKVSFEKLVKALAVAGIFGNIIKTNATISGAQGGCQAEIGTACAMAAGALGYVEGLNNHQISYAAEIGIEHNLGLTCDPVEGYVMIPCIERNGVCALRAIDAAKYAKYIGRIKPNRVSFDMVVETMNDTGKMIPRELKETSLGGLAEVVIKKRTD